MMLKKIIILIGLTLLCACASMDADPEVQIANPVPGLATVRVTVPTEMTVTPSNAADPVEIHPTETPEVSPPASTTEASYPGPGEEPTLNAPPTNTPAQISGVYPPPAEIETGQAQDPYPSPESEDLGLPTYGFRIINKFPHDPGAFTQGLVVTEDGQDFFEGTGLWGQSSLRRVDIESGEVIQLQELAPEYFGEGLTLFDNRIYQLTWQSNIGFIYDDQNFDLVGSFDYPHEGWGITHDGQELIVSDGTATIHFWDPDTLSETRQIQVSDPNGPITRLNELEYVNGEIWANVWQTDLIARISPDDGHITGWIDLTGLYDAGENASSENVLNGIAYDEQSGRLFVTGKRWPALFEIELDEP